MKKPLLILAIISFIIPIAYLHEWWSYILILMGIALLFIWKNTDKFIIPILENKSAMIEWVHLYTGKQKTRLKRTGPKHMNAKKL